MSDHRPNIANTAAFNQAMALLPQTLKQLGFESLRPGQDKAVFNLFMDRDTFTVLPTGHGKSLIYIVPTVSLRRRALIFSPLIALMQDQVESLWRMKLPAGQLSSGQTPAENQATLASWQSGELQFLLVAPERLPNERFQAAMRAVAPNLVVVDEAHCLSQWSDSFRPDYVKIGDFIKEYKPESVLCLTATAPNEVEADIRRVLGIPEALRVVYFPKRENLKLSSAYWRNNQTLLRDINSIQGPTIVYCATVRMTNELYAMLGDYIEGGALVYNGQMTPDERSTNQSMFMRNEVRVMFATNAFGLGVNKPDIRAVIHRDIPGSVDSLSQEMGRAGRDGLDSHCLTYYDNKSYDTQQWFIRTSYPERQDIEAVFHLLQLEAKAMGGNTVQQTLKDLSRRAYMNEAVISSVMGILAANKVVERGKEQNNPHRVQFLHDHLDEEHQQLGEQVRRFGFRTENGYEFDLEQIAQTLGKPGKKIIDQFRLLEKNGYLRYHRPFRGSTTRIIGDLGNVDFARIERKRRECLLKLDKIQDYIDTPNGQKHDFLQQYFLGDNPISQS